MLLAIFTASGLDLLLQIVLAAMVLVFYAAGLILIWIEPWLDRLTDWCGTLSTRSMSNLSQAQAAKKWKQAHRPTIWWLNPTWERRETLIFLWVLLVALLLFAREQADHRLPELLLVILFIGLPMSFGYIAGTLVKYKRF